MSNNHRAYEFLSTQSHSVPKEEVIYESEVALGRGYHFSNGRYVKKLSPVYPTDILKILDDVNSGQLDIVNMRVGKSVIDQSERVTAKFREDISKKLSLNANVPLGMITLGFLGEIENQIKKNESSEYFIYIYSEIESVSALDERLLAGYIKGQLKPQARADLSDVNVFVEKYGTHMVTGLYHGNILIIVGEKRSTSYFDRRRAHVKPKVSLDPSQISNLVKAGAMVEVDLDAEYVKEMQKDSTFGNFKLFQAGGINLSPEQINSIESSASPELAIREARKALDANRTKSSVNVAAVAASPPPNPGNGPPVRSFPKNIIGAQCDPYMKYIPKLQGRGISWHMTNLHNFEYLEVVSGSVNGFRYCYTSDEDQIVAVLAPRDQWWYTKSTKAKRYEVGFRYQNDELTPFIRKVSGTRHQISSTQSIHDNVSRPLVLSALEPEAPVSSATPVRVERNSPLLSQVSWFQGRHRKKPADKPGIKFSVEFLDDKETRLEFDIVDTRLGAHAGAIHDSAPAPPDGNIGDGAGKRLKKTKGMFIRDFSPAQVDQAVDVVQDVARALNPISDNSAKGKDDAGGLHM